MSALRGEAAGRRRPALGRALVRALPALAGLGLACLTAAACSDAFYPDFVAELAVTPDSLHLEPGETAELEATPVDERGVRLPERAHRIEWTTVDTQVVALEPDGGRAQVTARAPGAAVLRLELGQGIREIRVYVHPPGLASVAIDPPQVLSAPFGRTTLRARILTAAGAELPPEGFRISWTVEGPNVAGFASEVVTGAAATLFSRPETGTTTVRLMVNDHTAVANVNVTDTPSAGAPGVMDR